MKYLKSYESLTTIAISSAIGCVIGSGLANVLVNYIKGKNLRERVNRYLKDSEWKVQKRGNDEIIISSKVLTKRVKFTINIPKCMIEFRIEAFIGDGGPSESAKISKSDMKNILEGVKFWEKLNTESPDILQDITDIGFINKIYSNPYDREFTILFETNLSKDTSEAYKDFPGILSEVIERLEDTFEVKLKSPAEKRGHMYVNRYNGEFYFFSLSGVIESIHDYVPPILRPGAPDGDDRYYNLLYEYLNKMSFKVSFGKTNK